MPSGLRTLFHAGSLTGHTDGQLLERFSLSDGEEAESTLAALVARHAALVWGTCRGALHNDHDAGDAFQASFLVLVRKARSLWVRDSLGPWLHRVALRAALEAKRKAKRRRRAEEQAAELAREEWRENGLPDELAAIIHHEIDRLPERYRIPVVLCELEGRSLLDAARNLNCPVGTVKSRLARARQRLRRALLRRGVGPAAMLPAGAGSLPQGLTAHTIQSCALYVNNRVAAAGTVSAAVSLIAEGVLRMMVRAKLQCAVLGTLAAMGLLVAAWLAHAGQGVVNRPKTEAPAAAGSTAIRTVDLDGKWIVRGYPSGQAFGLIRIEGPPTTRWATSSRCARS
jgi:RNA polymerase sigma factor (sigma-70 family)